MAALELGVSAGSRTAGRIPFLLSHCTRLLLSPMPPGPVLLSL